MSFKIGSLTIYERTETPEQILEKAKRASEIQKLQAKARGHRAGQETEKRKQDVRTIIKIHGASDPRIKGAIHGVIESERKEKVYHRQETQASQRILFMENTKATIDAANSTAAMGEAIVSLSTADVIKDLPSKLQKTSVAQSKLATTTSYITDLLAGFDESLVEDEKEFDTQLDEKGEQENSDYQTKLKQFLDEDALQKMDTIPSVEMLPSIPSTQLPTPPSFDYSDLEKRFQALNKNN
jgi:hypothetical protein